jgi:hypothetical protein
MDEQLYKILWRISVALYAVMDTYISRFITSSFIDNSTMNYAIFPIDYSYHVRYKVVLYLLSYIKTLSEAFLLLLQTDVSIFDFKCKFILLN